MVNQLESEDAVETAISLLNSLAGSFQQLYDLSKVLQRALAEGDFPHFQAQFEKRNEQIEDLTERWQAYQSLLDVQDGLAANPGVRDAKSRMDNSAERFLKCDHYVQEGIAYHLNMLGKKLIEKVQYNNARARYMEATEANDLIRRIFGDNHRLFDTSY